MSNKIEKPKDLKEIKKERGLTNWAKLVSDEKRETNKPIRQR